MWALEVKDGRLDEVEVAEPEPGEQEVIVELGASSINNADLQRLDGHYKTNADAERVLGGMDVAGAIVELGDGVSDLSVGERVMSRASGSWAERVAISARDAVRVPDGWSVEEGAAAITGLMTEWHALRRAGRLSEGERVLIRGASSGVGLAAVEVAALLGAGEVIGSARSERAEEALLARGATRVVVESEGSLLEAGGEHGFDVIVDHVAGELFGEACESLAVGGRLVNVGRLGGSDARFDIDDLARKRAEVIGVSFRTRSPDQIAAISAGLRDELAEPMAAGRLRPEIDSRFELRRAGEALERLKRREHSGKIILVG